MENLSSPIKSISATTPLRLFFVLAMALLVVLQSGCNPNSIVDKAIGQIEETRRTIAAMSDGWRDELKKLPDNLSGLESQASADAKSMINQTANAASLLYQDSIKLADTTAKDVIYAGGGEFRCDWTFVQQGAIAQLQYLIDDLKFWEQNKRHTPQKPIHQVCGINPVALSLYQSGKNWLINTPSVLGPGIVGVYGYNFRSDALPTLELQDAHNTKIRDANVTVNYVTRFEMTLDFANEKFPDLSGGAKIVFRWTDQEDPNSIALTRVVPAKLEISQPVFSPSSPTALQNQVTLQVTVSNTGGTRSETFVAKWQPDPNDRKTLTAAPASPLEAGTSQPVSFGGYTYQRGGLINGVVSLDTGDDSKIFPLYVKTPPPADPLLVSAYIMFHTTDDNKNSDSMLFISLKNNQGTVVNLPLPVSGEFRNNSDTRVDLKLINSNVTKSQLAKTSTGSAQVRLQFAPAGWDNWHFRWDCHLVFDDQSTADFAFADTSMSDNAGNGTKDLTQELLIFWP